MRKTNDRAMFYGATQATFQSAELLRKDMTEAEKILWERLNKSQLGVRFKAQHPIDFFIADFYCHKYKLVVELDGKIHDFQKEYDEGRTAEIEKWGIKIIRFKNEDVLTNIENVIDEIRKHLVLR